MFLAQNKISHIYLVSAKPSKKRIFRIINDVAPRWYELGIELFDEKDEYEAKLDLIKTNHQNNNEECCKEMFLYWLKTHPKATWQQLLDSLKSSTVQLGTVAAKIKEMCCTGKGIAILALK